MKHLKKNEYETLSEKLAEAILRGIISFQTAIFFINEMRKQLIRELFNN